MLLASHVWPGWPTAARDRAIIMSLLDTAVRASELSSLYFEDLNLGNNSMKVRGNGPGQEGDE